MTILDRTHHLRVLLLQATAIDWDGDTGTGTRAVPWRRLRGPA